MRADFRCEEGQRNIPRCPGLDKKCSDHVSAETLESPIRLLFLSLCIAPLALYISSLLEDRSIGRWAVGRSVDAWFSRLSWILHDLLLLILFAHYILKFRNFPRIEFVFNESEESRDVEDGSWDLKIWNEHVSMKFELFQLLKTCCFPRRDQGVFRGKNGIFDRTNEKFTNDLNYSDTFNEVTAVGRTKGMWQKPPNYFPFPRRNRNLTACNDETARINATKVTRALVSVWRTQAGYCPWLKVKLITRPDLLICKRDYRRTVIKIAVSLKLSYNERGAFNAYRNVNAFHRWPSNYSLASLNNYHCLPTLE